MKGSASRATAVALVVLAVPLLAACGGDDDDGDSDRGAAASTSQPAEDLLGTYERTVTQADLARTADMVVKEKGFDRTLPGPQRLEIKERSFTVTDLRDNFPISQNVVASDEGLDIGDYIRPDKGAFCGPSVPQGAIYSWTLEDNVLTLQAESDSCADRNSVLTGEWTKTEEP